MKTLLMLIFCLFSINLMQAQTLTPFPSLGFHAEEIYHGDWTTGGLIFDRSFTYVRDTVVDGQSYAVLDRASGWNGNTLDYTRYDNGKVYFYRGTFVNGEKVIHLGTETLLYDFALLENDTFSHHFIGEWVVSDVSSTTLLNGETRKMLELSSTSNSNETRHWVDGIGDIVDGFYYARDFEGGREEFICASDATGGLWENPTASQACTLPVAIKNQEQLLSESIVLTAATDGLFTFNILGYSLKKYAIHVYDVTGRLLFIQKDLPSNLVEIALTKYNKGIYIAEFRTAEGSKTFKLLR